MECLLMVSWPILAGIFGRFVTSKSKIDIDARFIVHLYSCQVFKAGKVDLGLSEIGI